MGVFNVNGGNSICGEISIGGAKNSSLPILAATILNGNISYIHNCPKILDVFVMIKILKSLGCFVSWEGNTCIVDSSCVNKYEVEEKLVTKMRSSIIVMGSMLAKYKRINISYPGGCEIGLRPIDLHINSLRKMGVNIKEENGYLNCTCDKLVGASINLDFPSVGATENIMLAATLAEGCTTIYNPAKEPEIIDLQNFLNSMGAKVSGAGTELIVIEGVSKLDSLEHVVIPDRIVAGTYLIAAAITRGEILIKNVDIKNICSITSKLRDTGCTIKEYNDSIYLKCSKRIDSIDIIRTQPYPGFPTDMQPQIMSLLALANGTSIISETVFESRYKHVKELVKMGANIIIDGRTAIINGVSNIKGTKLESKDLRGGAALILAGLVAEGKSSIYPSVYIERGYEKFDENLRLLGADIVLNHSELDKYV